MNKALRSAPTLALLAALATAAHAGVLTDSVGTTGNQTFAGGETLSLGLDFNVGASPLLVTTLGAFDSGLDGFAAGTTITVGVFSRTTQTLVGPTLTFTQASPGTLVGAWREKALATPIALLAGGSYSIVAAGFNQIDLNLNTSIAPYAVGQNAATNSAPGLLGFVGKSRYSYNTTAYPTTVDVGSAIQYGAGNFTIQAVPEPSALAALGLGALAMLRRRKRVVERPALDDETRVL